MLLIEQIPEGLALEDLIGKQRDTVVMTSEERRWGRRCIHTSAGRAIGLALTTGTTLDPGTIIAIGPTWYLQVEAAAEPVLAGGGDNLAATFSPELVDATIYVVDVAEGDKISRKGGPGIMRSGLLVINKIDLAPYVSADLVVERDTRRARGERPFVFTNLREGSGIDTVVDWIRRELLFQS